MNDDVAHDLLDERLGHFHPAGKIKITVRFRQNRDAVPQADVVVAEARPVIEGAPGEGTAFVEVPVIVSAECMTLSDGRAHLRKQALPGVGDEAAVGVGSQRRRVGQVVAVERAIGRVQIDDHMRIPPLSSPTRARASAESSFM